VLVCSGGKYGTPDRWNRSKFLKAATIVSSSASREGHQLGFDAMGHSVPMFTQGKIDAFMYSFGIRGAATGETRTCSGQYDNRQTAVSVFVLHDRQYQGLRAHISGATNERCAKFSRRWTSAQAYAARAPEIRLTARSVNLVDYTS